MAKYANYYSEWRTSNCQCHKCGWIGKGSALAIGEIFEALTELDCPVCGESVLLVPHPTFKESRANWEKLDDGERQSIQRRERFLERFEREKLKDAVDLPNLSLAEFSVSWDIVGGEEPSARTVITLGDQVLFSEPALWEGYERFAEVARILKAKYGLRLKDVVPTERSQMYLWGDRISAPEFVDRVRRELFAVDLGAAE